MRTQSKVKQIQVTYKGWRAVQTPWNDCGFKYYARRYIDPAGNESLHIGRARHVTRKQLKLGLMTWVDKELFKALFSELEEGNKYDHC